MPYLFVCRKMLYRLYLMSPFPKQHCVETIECLYLLNNIVETLAEASESENTACLVNRRGQSCSFLCDSYFQSILNHENNLFNLIEGVFSLLFFWKTREKRSARIKKEIKCQLEGFIFIDSFVIALSEASERRNTPCFRFRRGWLCSFLTFKKSEASIM